MWEKRRGMEGKRQRQLQCMLLYSGERLWYICLLKALATDKHSAAAEGYKALSVAPEPAPLSQQALYACSVHSDKKGVLSTAPWFSEEG